MTEPDPGWPVGAACLGAAGAVTTAAADVEVDPDRPGVADPDEGEEVGGAFGVGLVVLPECSTTGTAEACSPELVAVSEGVCAVVCEEEELVAAGSSLGLLITIGARAELAALDCAGRVATGPESVAVAEPGPSSDDLGSADCRPAGALPGWPATETVESAPS